jgi:monofunctional biosynthetic peptidoglycan transglycosylase
MKRQGSRMRKVSRRLVGRIVLATAATAFAYLSYLYLTLPDVRPLATTNPATTAFMELRAREARARGRERRHSQRWVSYNRISGDLKRAVLVAEDAAFWEHDGVDYAELQKSIELDWARGQLVRGASTITQQLAKNLYLSPSRNPLRKLRELIIARRLEVELQKARILEIYLNVIEWGDGIFGVEAAAGAYFGKPASALSRSEAALLAAAIPNPRIFNPAKPSAYLLRRQQVILRRMGGVAPPTLDDKDGAEPGVVPEVPADEPIAPLPGVETLPGLEAAPSPDGATAPESTRVPPVEI